MKHAIYILFTIIVLFVGWYAVIIDSEKDQQKLIKNNFRSTSYTFTKEDSLQAQSITQFWKENTKQNSHEH